MTPAIRTRDSANGVTTARTVPGPPINRRKYRHRIIDRWVGLCAFLGFVLSFGLTDWDLEIVAVVTAGSALFGMAIGVMLVMRLLARHDKWMKLID